jgi:hypothetical protein
MIPLAILVGGCVVLWWLKSRPSRPTYRCHCGRTFTTLNDRAGHRRSAHPE